MTNVSFEEEQLYVRPNFMRASRKGLNGLVIKWGWAKDDAGAGRILLIIALILLIAAISTPFVLGGFKGNPPVPKSKIDSALILPPQLR